MTFCSPCKVFNACVREVFLLSAEKSQQGGQQYAASPPGGARKLAAAFWLPWWLQQVKNRGYFTEMKIKQTTTIFQTSTKQGVN